MKTLNKIFTILLIATLSLMISCGSDDDNNPPQVNNKFTIQNTDYATPNAYLILDDGPLYTEGFGLGLINGSMREDNVNGSSISTNTTHGIALWVRFGNSTVTSEQIITNQITNGSTFNLDDESTAFTNVVNYVDTYSYGGFIWGEPDVGGTATAYEIDITGNGTVTINSFTVDLGARTGTVDCTYTITDNNNIIITGGYNGTFNIINEF